MNTKERPICRQIIINRVMRPNPTPEKWDNTTALTHNACEVRLTDGLRKQMGKMIQEGYWGKPIPLRQVQNAAKESELQRETRLQALCDSLTILDHKRPIPLHTGDKLIRVRHSWPLSRCWEYTFDYDLFEYVPITKPPFHYVPGWVFEDENPLTATARMAFAYLCNRSLLNSDQNGNKVLTVTVSWKDIGNALEVPESAAGRALIELEELEIIRISRPALGARKKAIYCNSITAIEDAGRWRRIKTAQADPP